jgi:hypothetical protein
MKGIRSGGVIDPKDMREAKYHVDGLNKEIDKLGRLFDAATGRANKFQTQIDRLTDEIERLHKAGGQEILIQKKEVQIDAIAGQMNANDDLATAYKKEIDRLKAMLAHQQSQLGGFKEGPDAQPKAPPAGPRQTVGQALTGWMPDWMRRYGGQALGLLGAYSAYQQIQTGLNNSANLYKMASDMGIRENLHTPEQFNTFRDSLYKSGYGKLGFKGLESMSMANTMQSLMGYIDAETLNPAQRFTRAYGLEGGETSQFFGRQYQLGAFGYGPSNINQFAERLASYIDRSKMQGRAVEAMESMSQIMEKWGGRNPGALDSTGAMAVLTAFNQTGLEGFRGARGAQFVGMLDQSIASASNPAVENGLLTAFGWGKGISYFDAKSRQEDGASPENLRDAMKYIQANYGGDQDQMLLALRGFFPGLTVKQAKAMMGIDFNSLDAIKGAIGMDGGRVDSKVDNWAASQGGQLYQMDARTDELQMEVGDKLLPTLKELQRGLQDLADWAIGHPVLAGGMLVAGTAIWNSQVGGPGGGGAPGVPGAPGAPGMPGAPGGGGGWLSNLLGVAGGQAAWQGVRSAGGWATGALAEGGVGTALGMGAAILAPLGVAAGGLYVAGKMDANAERIRMEKGAQGWFSLQNDVGSLRAFGGADGFADQGLFGQISTMQNLFTGDIKGVDSQPQKDALKRFQVAMLEQARYNIMRGSNSLFGTNDPLAYLRQNGLDDIIAGNLEAWMAPGDFTAGIQQNQFYVNQERLRGTSLTANGGLGFITNSRTSQDPTTFGFTSQKLDDLNKVALSAGIHPELLLAILQQEGTGSFNTLSPTRLTNYHAQGKYLNVSAASDGGYGPNPNWQEDLLLAVNLIKEEQSKWEQMTKDQQSQYGDFLTFVNKRYAEDPNWSTGVRNLLTNLGGNPNGLFFNPADAFSRGANGLPKGWTWDTERMQRDSYMSQQQGIEGPPVPELRKVTVDEEALANAIYKAQQDYRAGERSVTISGTARIDVNVNGKDLDPQAEHLLEMKFRKTVQQVMQEAKYEETYSNPHAQPQMTQW